VVRLDGRHLHERELEGHLRHCRLGDAGRLEENGLELAAADGLVQATQELLVAGLESRDRLRGDTNTERTGCAG
jgi:hypothetical protein